MRGIAAALAGLAAWTLVTRRIPRLRLRARIALPPPATVAAALASGATAGALALGLLAVPAAAAAVAVLGVGIPFAARAARSRRTRERMAQEWPDFVALVRGRLSGGATLPEAFVAAAERSSVDSLRDAAATVDEAIMRGRGFEPALEQLRLDLDDPTADRVLTTIIAAHRAGGQRVGHVLSALAASVADELQLRRAHDAALTQQRLTALVALLAPWILLALTVATNPQAAATYRTATGSLIIAAGLAVTGVGYILARRTARLSQPPRVFR